MSTDLAPAYQYVCGSGHYCAGPKPLTGCLVVNCTSTLTRIGKGSKK